jgi:prepilin-type N-terminal cleavage/methylation domain-containing protein/prepilin-type processing-associated H-X9-DG protein
MRPAPRAFTLIELLAVIAVVGVLTAIGVGAVSLVRQKAHQTRCTANLRSIGVAMMLHIGEHRNTLPGPTFTGAKGAYNRSGGSGELAAILAPYLDIRPLDRLVGNEREEAPMFQCPSRPIDASATSEPPVYGVQCALNPARMPNNSGRPMGVASDNPANVRLPVRITDLDAVGGPARVWALIEMDRQVAQRYSPFAGWAANLPEKPAHGGGRNALYFDGHVSRLTTPP